MKKILMSIGILFGVVVQVEAQRPSIGGYKVFYGALHNHSQICGHATGTADDVYNYAKNTSKLDFFSMAEHNSYSRDQINWLPMNQQQWDSVKNAANKYNEDGVFTALWGFEWSDNNYGHVAVIGSSDYATWSVNSFASLCTWLSSRDAVAFFNHPGRQDGTGVEFDHFVGAKSDKFVGMELWNKTDGFQKYFYNDGYNLGDQKSYFDEANNNGWKVGAAGAFDNHSGSPGVDGGVVNPKRHAVLANSLNRSEIMSALKARRFFSTSDQNIALSFKINGNEMGSTILAGTGAVQVQATDANGELFAKVELRKAGTVINAWTLNTASVNVTCSISSMLGDDFYYVVVKQADGDEAVSSPIFVSSTNQTVTKSIASGLDDVEEASGTMITNSSDLEMPLEFNTQTIGLRFSLLNIPRGATINNAYIQFSADETSSDVTSLQIWAHAHDNSPAFTTTNFDLDNRTKTSSSVSWAPSAWVTIGEASTNQRTPDLKGIVQEVVNRVNYITSSSMTFLIKGSGKRVATSFEGGSASAPLLVVNYTYGGVTSTVSKRIASANDDAEQYSNGWMYLTSTDLELVYDHLKQSIGLRFQNVGVPANATISNAYLQFTVDETNSQSTVICIRGEASDNSSAFTSAANNVSGRIKTSASVTWVPTSWLTIGTVQQSPSVKTIIQEIVNRPGYSKSSALSFILDGSTGFRVASAYESAASKAAKLVIEYTSTLKSGYEEAGEDQILAINETNGVKSNVIVYPNPSDDFINLENASDYTDYKILDIYGRVIVTSVINGKQISVQHLPVGLYVIVVSNEIETISTSFEKR